MAEQEKTRFELFHAKAKSDISAYRDNLRGDGSFEYIAQVIQLERLSHKINQNMLSYLFGDILGRHLAVKFATDCNRNLLTFLSKLTEEYRIFILHELKNNKNLFAYC
jgi:hypothetical protein